MSKVQYLERQIKDWKIKYGNLQSTKKISDEEHKEEVSSLEREVDEKNNQINSLFETIRKLDVNVDLLTNLVATLKKENTELKEVIKSQGDQIEMLKGRLNKSSETSSKPPSTDGFKKKIQNNRVKTDKKVGGQIGHKGSGLHSFSSPTEIIEKKAENCTKCGGELFYSSEYKAKQVVDIEILVKVTEERVFKGSCAVCGKIHTGSFSEEFINTVQYGENIKSLSALLNSYGFLSIGKTSEIINSLTNNILNLSNGTIVNITNSLSGKLEETVNHIKEKLIHCKVLHADETGCRVNGTNNWIQVFSNDFYTLFNHNTKRGTASIEESGVLEFFVGILVHDHFSAYYKNTLVSHAECNAHILRYLKGVLETFKHEWAKDMIYHLVDILKMKKEKIALNLTSFSEDEISDISCTYDKILEKGTIEYQNEIAGKKNISYFNEERLLLKRLGEYKAEHLLFATDFEAPFDNNQAERDIRPYKTKLKVSGGFRSDNGAEAFSRIFSVISTLKKQNKNIFRSIREIFENQKVLLE
jgi:transposase